MQFPVNVNLSSDPVDNATVYNFFVDDKPAGSGPKPALDVPVASPGDHSFGVQAANDFDQSEIVSVKVGINPVGKPTNIHVSKA